MRTHRIAVHAVITAGIAAAVSLAIASPAQANPGGTPTECTGTIGAVTVHGDVVVPNGAACTLAGTTVRGGVSVGSGAALDTSDVSIKKSITLSGSGRFLSSGTVVWGSVSSTGTGIVALTDTIVVGNLTVRQDTTFSATRLGVGGTLRGTELSRLDLAESAVAGSLIANGVFSGTSVCDSFVNGNASVSGSGGGIEIGGAGTCAGNDVRGSVVLTDNVADTVVGGNTIRRDLNCTGNDPAPTGSGNTVQGQRLGQCAML